MTNEKELFTDHEVRIRLLEKIAEKIDQRFDHLESKMSNQFFWLMATMFLLIITMLGFYGTVTLHALKLV